jgi:hypothetical protein
MCDATICRHHGVRVEPGRIDKPLTQLVGIQPVAHTIQPRPDISLKMRRRERPSVAKQTGTQSPVLNDKPAILRVTGLGVRSDKQCENRCLNQKPPL